MREVYEEANSPHSAPPIVKTAMKVLLSTLALCVSLTSAIWPIPSQYSAGTSVLWISRDVQFSYSISRNAVSRNQNCRASPDRI